MRVALETWPLLSLAGHCLRSGGALSGTVLAEAPVSDFSVKSFNSEMCFATPVMACSCVAANSDHFLVRTSVDLEIA